MKNLTSKEILTLLLDGAHVREREYSVVLAAMESARAVAVLDGWKLTVGHTVQEWTDPKESWCELVDSTSVIAGANNWAFSGATPGAARAKAAAVIESGKI